MTRHPALRDVDAKLAGAKDRLKPLERCINEGAVSDLVLGTWTDRDRQRRVRVRVKELAEIPKEWHVWIGEFVHDMRSALDHLAFALNVVGFRSDPPSNWKRSQFPIYSKRGDFRDMARKAKSKRPDDCPIRNFPRGARTRVESLQPYHHRKNPDVRWLEVLAELSNIDKHRGFPLTPVTPSAVIWPKAVEGHSVADTKTNAFRALKPNTTIAWLKVPTLPLDVTEPQVNLGYACGLNLKRKTTEPVLPLVLPFEPVDFVLRSILKFIRETVLPTFEPFLG